MAEIDALTRAFERHDEKDDVRFNQLGRKVDLLQEMASEFKGAMRAFKIALVILGVPGVAAAVVSAIHSITHW